MAVALIGRVTVDRINKQARDLRFWRTVATLLASLLWGLGWLTAHAFAVTWRAAAWTATAVYVGWTDARQPPREGGSG